MKPKAGVRKRYLLASGLDQTVLRVPAGYGKVAVPNALQSRLEISSDSPIANRTVVVAIRESLPGLRLEAATLAGGTNA